MKHFYKFLFYKLYRYAKAEEQSVSLSFNFIFLATVFQELHLTFLIFPYNFFKINLNFRIELLPILMFIIGILFNYLYFIRSKRIDKINVYYQSQKRVVWRDNLMFFGYIILLFFIMFFQVFLLKKV